MQREKIQGTEQEFVNELKSIPGVTSASYTFNNIVGHTYGDFGLNWEGKNPNEKCIFRSILAVGNDLLLKNNGYAYPERQGIPQKHSGADTVVNIILNEAAVKIMSLKRKPGWENSTSVFPPDAGNWRGEGFSF